MLDAVGDSAICKVDEDEVGKGIDDLGNIGSRIVVLYERSGFSRVIDNALWLSLGMIYLFTPLKRRCDWSPVSLARWRVRE